jgi:hypothetical protein
MLARNSKTTIAEPRDAMTDLREFLDGIAKGPQLQLAGRAVTAARRARAELVAAQEPERAELREAYANGTLANYRRAHKIDAALAEADRGISDAVIALRAARKAWTPRLVEALAPVRAKRAQALVALAEAWRLESEQLAAIDYFASCNGITLPGAFIVSDLSRDVRLARKLAGK